jgi:hypothetical protein
LANRTNATIAANGSVDVDLEGAEQDERKHRDAERAEEDNLLDIRLRQRQTRPAQHGERDQDRIFGDPAEYIRRDQAGADPADHAARRHPHVEGGEMAGSRPAPGELAMAHHRSDEERA